MASDMVPVQDQGAAPRKGRPVLIVDNDAEHRQSCRELLEEAGFTVVEASNGRKALERLLAPGLPQPGLILLELSMPVMDGWELLSIVKNYVRLHAIPVILLSAHEPNLDPVRHGAVAAHLCKPHDAGALMALTDRYCQPIDSAQG